MRGKVPLMNLKQIIKIVVFVAIFGVILYFLCDIFEYKNNYMAKGYETLKACEDDTVDAVFIGTSGVSRSWIAVQGYADYGMTVMSFAIDALPCWLAIDMIKETYKFQHPGLLLLDMRMFTLYDPAKVPDLSVTRSRRVIDTLDFFSPNRLDAVNRTLKLASGFENYDMSRFDPSLYLSFIQYHGMWADDGFKPFEQIGSPAAKYLGFYVNGKNSVRAKELDMPEWTDESIELPSISIDSLNEVLDYCSDNNIEVLFVDTPHYLSKVESKRNNALCRILDEKGIKYVMYSGPEWYLGDEEAKAGKSEELKFNRFTHFYDSSHLNYYGAVVFTKLFSEYLDEHYDLPDHRGDERCPEWEGKNDKLIKKMQSLKEAREAKNDDDGGSAEADQEAKERQEALDAAKNIGE